MLIKALKDCSYRTKEGTDLQQWEIYDIEDNKYKEVLNWYRGIIELLPVYIQCWCFENFRGKHYKEWDIVEVDFETYKSLKSRYYEKHKYFDKKEDYLALIDNLDNIGDDIVIEETSNNIEEQQEKPKRWRPTNKS